MRLPDHFRRDRVLVAQLRGTVSRHIAQHTPVAEAVAELQSITTDPHLLAHATTSRGDANHWAVRNLLLAAGADPQAIEDAADEIAANVARGGLGGFAQRMNTARGWRDTEKRPAQPEG